MPIGMALRAMMGAAGVAKDLYLYDEGAGEDEWVEGFTQENPPSATVTYSKEADHLYIEVYDEDLVRPEGTWVTDAVVDLTDWNTLKVEWAAEVGAGAIYGYAYLIASTNKTANYATYNARHSSSGTFGKRTNELDVSGLSGNHYIRVHRDIYSEMADTGWLKVYKVWLE